MKRRVGLFDLDTGEQLPDIPMLYRLRAYNGFGDRWMQMSQDALEALATAGLSGRDFQVLMLLIARLDFENLIAVNHTEVAKVLGLQPTNVGRSIRRLAKLEIILEGPRVGVTKTYRLNPAFGWKGSAKGHREALRKRLEVISGGRVDQPTTNPCKEPSEAT